MVPVLILLIIVFLSPPHIAQTKYSFSLGGSWTYVHFEHVQQRQRQHITDDDDDDDNNTESILLELITIAMGYCIGCVTFLLLQFYRHRRRSLNCTILQTSLIIKERRDQISF